MSQKKKVTVIGGGVVGIACAHYLREAGHDVMIVDRDSAGKGSAAYNCGHILPSHVEPLNSRSALLRGLSSLFNPRSTFKIGRKRLVSLSPWLWKFMQHCNSNWIREGSVALMPLQESSLKEFLRLPGQLLRDAEWQQNGLLYAFRSNKGLSDFASLDARLSAELGVSAEYWDARQLTENDPQLSGALSGGFFYEKDAQLRPELFLSRWVSFLKDQGVEFLENASVERVDVQNESVVSIKTVRGLISTNNVVLAAGAASSQLARHMGFKLPVIPGKGYTLTLGSPTVRPRHSMVLPENQMAITPFDNALRLGSMMEFVGFDSSISSVRMNQLLRDARPYFQNDIEGRFDTWSGLRPMTWDSLPVIGRPKQLKNVVVATGHGMIGLMTAPATGKLVREILDRREPHIPAQLFSPNRFN